MELSKSLHALTIPDRCSLLSQKTLTVVALLLAPSCCAALQAGNLGRRAVFQKAGSFAAASALVTHAQAAHALALEPPDNEIVPNQVQQPGKLDVNNSPVADYMRYPGMYPKIGGAIANGGPYSNVRDVYKNAKLTDADKATIKKYEGSLIATAANPLLDPMRGRDPYRGAFNDGPAQTRQ